MACEDTRQLTEAQRVAGYQNGRTGVPQAVRPFSGRPTIENLIDYINRELFPAVKRTRDKVNDIYLPTVDNAPSGNPLGFYFSTNTANADPTAGRIRLNQATQDTATIIRVSESNGRLADVAPWLDVMAGSVTSPLGVVTLTDAINPSRFIRFDLSSMVDAGAYWNLTVAPIESSHDNPFVDGGAVVISFIPGVGGATAATIPPTAISGADGPRQFLSTSTGTTVDWRTLSVNFPGAPIYDVVAYPFSAANNGSTDDTSALNAAIAAANAAPGVIYLGSRHLVSAALTAITNNNVWIVGRGNFNGGTIISVATAAAVDGAITFSGGRDCGARDFWLAADNAFTTGVGVMLTGATRVTIQDLLISGFATGVEVDRCNTTYLRRVRIVDVLGPYGVHIHGEAPSSFNHIVNLDNCLVGQSYPLTLNDGRGDWATGTAYALGDVVRANGGLWQCSTAGTSSGAGSGPGSAGLPSSLVATVHTTTVSDGSAVWRFAMGAFDGYAHGSFAHTVLYDRCGVLQGYRGWYIFDDAGDAPTFIHGWQCSADHPLLTGILLEACDGAVMFDQTLSTSILVSGQPGITIGANATRWQFSGGEANQGITIAGTAGVVRGMHTSTIAIATTGRELLVEDNHLTGNITIAAGADDYVVQGNFVNGSITNTPGRADTRVVQGNIPDTEIAAGSVWGLQTDHGSSDVPREITKVELGENLRLDTLVTDSSTSGTASPYSVATQVNWVRFNALTGTYTVNGCDNVESGKIIVWHVEPGVTGSLVLVHNNGAITNNQRFFCPGATNLTLSSGECAITVQTTNRQRVLAVSKVGFSLTDGDKGDITVASGGTSWTIDNDAVSDAKLRNSAALSVIGRSANSTGDPADISGTASSDAVLRISGTVLGFGTVATAGIADAAVTLAKQANLAQSTIIGRAESAGTGVPTALSSTQVVAIINGEPIEWLNDHAFTGTSTRVTGAFRFDGVGTTATTAANDLVINAVNVVRFTGPVDPLTGMVATGDAQTVLLVNAHASTNMGVHMESASSSAANRFAGTGTSRVIRPGEMGLAWYDGTSSRWRLLCRDDVDL